MPSLDLRSLAAMSGIMAVVLGLVLLGVRANFPASIRGLRFWGLAPLLCASSTVLFVLNGVLPNWLLVLAGNGLLMTGFGFFLFGSQRFFGQPVTWRRWGAVAFGALVLMGVFLWWQPDYRVRVLNGGTEAVTRVLVECADEKGERWTTVGVSPNIIDASFEALLDSITWKLIQEGATA